MTKEGLCLSCVYSVWCPTWAEYKCLEKKIRFTQYGFKQPTTCDSYKKRDKNFKEHRCQCNDCLKNEVLLDEEEMENK